MKFEHTQVFNFDGAIRGMILDFNTSNTLNNFIDWIMKSPSKSYYTWGNKYYVYIKGKNNKNQNLGSYFTELEAINKAIEVKFNNIRDKIFENNLNNIECKIYNNYLVFKSGDIMSLLGHILKGFIDRSGYREVIMNNRYERVHRMVAEAFLPNPNNLRDVNHIDGNKLNNNVENLEWASHPQNALHAWKNNLITKNVGEAHHRSKLTNKAVLDIRKQMSEGISTRKELAIKYGVDETTIRDIIVYRTWRHV